MIRHLQMWSKREADTSIRGLPFYVKRETFSKADSRQRAAYILSAILVITMLCVIFRFSAADATHSSHLSEGVCIRLVREVSAIFPEQFPKEKLVKVAEAIEYPVRKCAHFTEYAVLGITVNLYLWMCYRMEMLSITLSMWNFIIRAEIFCALYACSDEFHQYFVPGRSCKFFDVCVDSSGAFFGALLFWGILHLREQRRERKREEISKKSKS